MFIFGKRQIMRFALKSRRGPHIPIAPDAPRYLRKEIDRRLEIVKEIKFEPKLIEIDEPESANQGGESQVKYNHEYRMKSVDELVKLERTILEVSDAHP